jgi:hypothetical protein
MHSKLLYIVLVILSCATIVFALNDNELRLLRTKDIKKILLELGIDRNEINKHLDKDELIALVQETIQKQVSQRDEDLKFHYYTKIAIYSLIIILITLFYKHILAIILSTGQSLWGDYWIFTEKFKLVRQCIKYRILLALLAISTSCIIDVAIPLIHISTLLSWVIPSSSFLRQYLFPTPHFPISPHSILGRGPTTGLNIGPMVFLWVLKYSKDKLENFAAGKIVETRSSRKSNRNRGTTKDETSTSESADSIKTKDWKSFAKECKESEPQQNTAH